MTRRLLLTYLTLTAFVLIVLEVPLGLTFAEQERRALMTNVQNDALVLATFFEDPLEKGTTTGLPRIASDYKTRTGGRVVVVDPTGSSVADTDESVPQPFSTRPEFMRALRGEIASGIRHSNSLRNDLVFAAVPVASGGVVYGAVRITYPSSELSRRIRRNWLTLTAVGAIVLAAASTVGLVLARSVTRPLGHLKVAAGRLADGDFTARAPEGEGPPEVREVAREVNDMASRLEELISAQRAFVADASHQLRTPLTALRLRLETLEGAVGPSAAEDLEAASREAWRLARLVEGLLALARAEGTRPERAPVDVLAVADERRTAWAPLAEERGVVVRVDRDGTVAALVPHGYLEQILDNLLGNALDAAPDGSTVTLRAERSHDWVTVHVIDEGPGMSEEDRRRAFDRFWRGPDAEAGGTGLGLAIVRQLARTSGGDAELSSGPAGGVDAVVRLRPA